MHIAAVGRARYLVEAHLIEGRPVSELARDHGVSRSWLYKQIARYHQDGVDSLAPRSRRPNASPKKIPKPLEDEVVEIRTRLADQGLDAGPQTIHWHLAKCHTTNVPSRATIWRVLKRRGLIEPQPSKRPRSSFIRFQADLPNECWQSDMTHYSLADGENSEIVNFIDDHSRLCLASVALSVAKATDVLSIFRSAKERYGAPASVLTDNGCIYTGRFRNGKVALERELEQLGIEQKNSSPYHPQTCGKVERFHQTLKRYLDKQKPATSLPELQGQIDQFVAYYNTERPHRALSRQTPQEAFDAKVKARPAPKRAQDYRVRKDKIDKAGKLTLRYNGRLHHIGVGRAYKGTSVTVLMRDLEIRIIDQEGELLRQLTFDPTRSYQPISKSNVSLMS